MLNAPTMECDGVNLRRSVPTYKRQQIFETVPVSHRAPTVSEYSVGPFDSRSAGNRNIMPLLGLG